MEIGDTHVVCFKFVCNSKGYQEGEKSRCYY